MTRTALLLVASLLAPQQEGAAQRPSTSAAHAPVAPDSTGAADLALALEDVVARVTTRSTAVLLAGARRDEADAAVGLARAARLPTINANAQFTWQPTANDAPDGFSWAPDPTAPLDQRVRYLELATPAAGLTALPPQLFALASRYAWTGGVSMQTTLLDGGRMRAGVASAAARREAAIAALDAERSRARLDAELAYRQLQLARERVAVAEAARETMAQDTEATRQRWSRGVSSELDVMRSEMQLADVDRRLADAVAAEHAADVHLRVLADLPAEPMLALTTPAVSPTAGGLEELEPSALLDAVQAASRASAGASVRSAEADLRAARANGRPSLVLRGDVQAIRAPTDPFDLGGEWTNVRTLSAAIQLPLFRPGRRYEVRGAEARLAQATLDARRVADGETTERASARAERRRASAAWQSARHRLMAAQRVAALTDSAAARGIATNVDRSRARLDELEARTQVLEALIDYLSADAVAGTPSRGNDD